METKYRSITKDEEDFEKRIQATVGEMLQEEATKCLAFLGIDFTDASTVDDQMKANDIYIISVKDELQIFKKDKLEYAVRMETSEAGNEIHLQLVTVITSNLELVQ